MPKSSSSSRSSSSASSSVDSCSGQFHERGQAYDCWKCAGCGDWYCFGREPGATSFAGPPRLLDRRYGTHGCYGRAGRYTKTGRLITKSCAGRQIFLAPPVANQAQQPDQPDFPLWDPKKCAYRKENNVDATDDDREDSE